MLSYIVDPAPETESEKVRFRSFPFALMPFGRPLLKITPRYPAICTEIFIADPDKLLGAISGEKANLAKLFSFFALPNVHLLVANLVVKLINTLLASKTAPVVAFLKSDAKWLKDVVSHLEAAAVHELLQKLIPVEGMLQYLLDSNLDELLVASFAKVLFLIIFPLQYAQRICRSAPRFIVTPFRASSTSSRRSPGTTPS
jgi:hypothetical protein